MKTLSPTEIEKWTQEEPEIVEKPKVVIEREEYYEPRFEPTEPPIRPKKLPTQFMPTEIPKKTNWLLIIPIIIGFLLLVGNLIWFNYSFSNGKAQGNSTVTNNIDTPDVPITIDDKDSNNFNHTITNNVKIEISEADKEDLAEDIAERVLEELNDTN